MHGARTLAKGMAIALLLAATLARADQPPPEPAPADAAGDDNTEPVAPPAELDDAKDPTWFGMGFESRQERFRRDLGMPAGQPGGGSPGNGGTGKGAGP